MMSKGNNIIKRRLLESLAILVVGDSVLTMVAPQKHVSLWQGGPKWWRRTCDTFDRHPTATRALGVAGLGLGLWLAHCQETES